MIVTQVTRHDTGHRFVTYVTVTVTQSYDIEKIMKGFETNKIIQYSNNMLAL